MFTLTPAQADIIKDTHRFRVVVCGRKFGKTTTSSEEITACAFSKNGMRVMYIAPTLDDARRLMWERIKNKFEGCTEKSNDTRLELTVPTQDGGKSYIFLGSWEKVNNYRGDEFDLIIFDEVQDYRNFWIGWQESMRPTLTPRMGTAVFIGTPKGFNHLYDLYNTENEDKDFKSFHFTSYDNPHLPYEEIQNARRQLTEDRFAQEYLADFRKTQGLVYKEFNRLKHIYTDTVYQAVDRLAGIDWGYTNPTASHLIEKDTDRHYWISHEYYKTGKTTLEIIEYVKSMRPTKVYPDPAEPDRNEEARKAGLNVREVTKDVEAGINCVRELLKQDRLHIHASCLNLIWEFETYMYPDKKPEHNEPEAPIKENDHALDEIRYVLYMQEGKGNNGKAHVHYSDSTRPRNNLTPFQEVGQLPLFDDKPKEAYTHYQHL